MRPGRVPYDQLALWPKANPVVSEPTSTTTSPAPAKEGLPFRPEKKSRRVQATYGGNK